MECVGAGEAAMEAPAAQHDVFAGGGRDGARLNGVAYSRQDAPAATASATSDASGIAKRVSLPMLPPLLDAELAPPREPHRGPLPVSAKGRVSCVGRVGDGAIPRSGPRPGCDH